MAVATGPAQGLTTAASIYPGPKKNIVFNVATIWWAQGFSNPPDHILSPGATNSRPHEPDPRVQRITQNLFGATMK